MANIPKGFIQNKMFKKDPVVNSRARSCLGGGNKNNSNTQPPKDKDSGGGDGDDGDGDDGFQEREQSDKMALLLNAGLPDLRHPVPGSSPLTIKPRINESPSVSDRLLTVSDIASFLNISRTTLYRLVEDRKIPFVRIGGLIRFTKANLEELLKAGHVNPII